MLGVFLLERKIKMKVSNMENTIYKNKFRIVENENITCDELLEVLLKDNPIFAVGVKNSTLVKLLSKDLAFHQRVGLCGDGKVITIHIAKMSFNDYEDKNMCRHIRMKAIYELFNRWTAAGYNTRKAKEPFGCKSFNEFFNIVENADLPYIVFGVPTEIKLDSLYKKKQRKMLKGDRIL